MVHKCYLWMFAIEHSAVHCGQLVISIERTILWRPTHDHDMALKVSTVSLTFVCSSNRERTAQMKQPRILLVAAVLIFVITALGKGTNGNTSASSPQAQQPQSPTTIAATVDRQISGIEKQIVEAAEAMPEDKFNFSPGSLNIPGADYQGVRSFAMQVKHVGASNYAIWSPLTGDKLLREDFNDGKGPENLKTKADIIEFLKRSFALGHKAAATLTTQNMLQTAEGSKSIRLHLATFAVAHAFDHYGQMVEYLRMNGIVPPASRGKSD